MSQFGQAIFYMRKTSKTSGKSGRQHVCLLEWPATGIVASAEGHHGWAPPNSITCTAATAVCARARVCARVCAHVGMRACVRDVFAIYYNNIWPRLMIIMTIIILYFIRHTDDFPSTSTRLVYNTPTSMWHEWLEVFHNFGEKSRLESLVGYIGHECGEALTTNRVQWAWMVQCLHAWALKL